MTFEVGYSSSKKRLLFIVSVPLFLYILKVNETCCVCILAFPSEFFESRLADYTLPARRQRRGGVDTWMGQCRQGRGLPER